MTPQEYSKLRGISPQAVGSAIRTCAKNPDKMATLLPGVTRIDKFSRFYLLEVPNPEILGLADADKLKDIMSGYNEKSILWKALANHCTDPRYEIAMQACQDFGFDPSLANEYCNYGLHVKDGARFTAPDGSEMLILITGAFHVKYVLDGTIAEKPFDKLYEFLKSKNYSVNQ